MIKSQTVQRSLLGSILMISVLFGAGCTTTNKTTKTSNMSRKYQDLPFKCNTNSPATPPCTYQTTPDGLYTTYVQGIKPSTSSTVFVAVHPINGEERVIYSMPRQNGTIYRTVGISDNGQMVYLHENLFGKNSIAHLNRSNLNRIDTRTHELTKILSFDGGPLDVYASKNLMVLWMIDVQTKTEKVLLTDLEGKTLHTLYEGLIKEFIEPPEPDNLMDAYNKANIVLFFRAIISPDGSKVLLEAFKNDLWPEFTLFNINNGQKTVLDDIDSKKWKIDTWINNKTLLMESSDATSTYSIGE